MEVIKAPNIDKLVLFECAEVLNEVLKAVSSGKKALRIDYTPYNLVPVYQKPKPVAIEPIPED